MSKSKIATVSRNDGVVEAKVRVGALVSGVTGLVLSLLNTVLGEVPGMVEQFVTSGLATLVPAGVTYFATWLTGHTPLKVDAVRDQQGQ